MEPETKKSDTCLNDLVKDYYIERIPNGSVVIGFISSKDEEKRHYFEYDITKREVMSYYSSYADKSLKDCLDIVKNLKQEDFGGKND